MSSKINEYELAIKIAGMVEKSLGSSIKQTNSELNSIGSMAKKAAGVVTAAFAGIQIGHAISDVVSDFAELQQATANVSATLGKNSTPQILESYNKKATELSDTMSRTSTEVMEGFDYLALAGWNAEDSLKNVDKIVKSSVVSGMDLATCSDKITDSLSALGLKADDTARYTNTLALAQTKGNASMEDLLDSYLSVGGTIKNYNIPLNEATAILDKLADQGLKGSEAGNSLSAIFVNLMGKTGQAKEAMDELGVSLFDNNGNVKNMTKFLFELKNRLSGMTEEQRNTYISMIAGKNQLDAFNKMLNGTDENLVSLTEELKNTDGALDSAASTIDNTLIGNFKKLKNNIVNTANAVVKEFEPYLSSALEKAQAKILEMRPVIEAFVNKFIDNIPTIINTFKNLIPVIKGVVAAFIAFKAITTFVTIYSSIVKVIGVVKNVIFAFQAFAGGAATLGEAIALVCNPVGLVVTAIAAFIGIIVALYLKNEEFRNKVNEVWENIKAKVMEVVDNIKSKIAEHQDTINAVVSFVQNILGTVLVAYFSAFVEQVSNFIGMIGDVLNGIIDVIFGVIDIIVGICNGDWSKVWDGIKDVVQGAIDIIKGLWNGLVKLLSTPINAVVNLTKKVFGGKDDSGEDTVKVGHNAKGTKSWRGGLTYINEGRRGELINLPNGTQITSHSQTESLFNKIAKANAENKGSTIAKLVDRLYQKNTPKKNTNSNESNDEVPMINYNPTFQFYGEAPSKEDIVQASRMSQDEFDKMMKKWQKDKGRFKFA